MSPPRLPDWRQQLSEFLLATRTTPFAWGSHDCALWAAMAIDAMCGTAHAAAISGRYDSADGAVIYARSRGWWTAAHACRDLCGEDLVRVGLAEDGDVCARPLPTFPWGTILVRDGDRLVGPGHDGLESVPWRVALLDPRWSAFPVGRVA